MSVPHIKNAESYLIYDHSIEKIRELAESLLEMAEKLECELDL